MDMRPDRRDVSPAVFPNNNRMSSFSQFKSKHPRIHAAILLRQIKARHGPEWRNRIYYRLYRMNNVELLRREASALRPLKARVCKEHMTEKTSPASFGAWDGFGDRMAPPLAPAQIHSTLNENETKQIDQDWHSSRPRSRNKSTRWDWPPETRKGYVLMNEVVTTCPS